MFLFDDSCFSLVFWDGILLNCLFVFGEGCVVVVDSFDFGLG